MNLRLGETLQVIEGQQIGVAPVSVATLACFDLGVFVEHPLVDIGEGSV